MGATYLAAARPVRTPPAAEAGLAPPILSVPATAATPAVALATAGAAAPVVGIAPFRFASVARGASDLQCLTEAVYFEARGEPDRGQQAVAQVVLNRVRHPAFPKTICAVVHQRTAAGCQFSFACAPQPALRDESAWSRAQDVAKGALHGSVMREIGDATHFENARALAFAGLLKVAQIGEHVFYRFGGHNGDAGMFRQTPAPSTAAPAPAPLLASAAPASSASAPSPARPVLVAAASETPPPSARPATPTPPAMAVPTVLVPATAPAPAVTPTALKTAIPVASSVAS